ncbi:hypothetical protein C9994_14425 [Marivirga lumbricoides]|uniref:Uncharacterized protein n=1 Tax=Marivirga lumbricoides TaxID=1046115 RepID=A0A2T4DEB8_9BACT|nr:hypothetical protein C9994_14425 [Marivirga lumbricoides]
MNELINCFTEALNKVEYKRDMQQWAENWINDMFLAVKNQDKYLILSLIKENRNSRINWSNDIKSSTSREYYSLIGKAYRIIF